jgi:tetratricopeptide (TPR) repeat protein
MTLTSRTRRWLLGILIALGLLLLGWAVGVGEFAANQMSARALASRDYDAAARWAARAAWQNAQDAETEFLLARIARKRGLIVEMMQHLKRAGVLGHPSDRIRREEVLAKAQTDALDDVLEQLPALLQDQQGDGAEICEAFTNGLLRHGRLTEAKSLIQQWQAAYPNDPAPDVLLARLSEFDLRPKLAEQHYRDAIRKNANYFPAQFGLGRTLIELNQWLPAYEVFQRCLAMPVKAPAQFGMARCLVHLDREEEARSLLLAAADEPQESFLQALKQLGEPTEFDNLSLELGSLETKLGHLDDALRWLQRAVDYNPKHRQARYQLAMTLNAAGRAEEAKPHLEYHTQIQSKLAEIDRLHGLIEHNPNDWESKVRLGMLYLEVDSAQAGVFWLQSVLATHPEHRGAHAALADYYEQTATAAPELRAIAEQHRRRANPPTPTAP